jgi:hypothetical protein
MPVALITLSNSIAAQEIYTSFSFINFHLSNFKYKYKIKYSKQKSKSKFKKQGFHDLS